MKRYIKNAISPISDSDIDTQIEIAKNPETSAEVLDELSDESYWEVPSTVAENPNVSISTLEKLSNNKEEWVKVSVTKNPNVTSDILYDMAKHMRYDEFLLSEYLAINPNTPTEALDIILQKCIMEDIDYLADLPGWLAENPNISDDALIWLLDNDLLLGTDVEKESKARLGRT